MNVRDAAVQVGTDVAINLKLSVAGKLWNKYVPTSRIVESVALAAGTMAVAAKPHIDNVVDSLQSLVKGATNTGLTAAQRQGILREASQLGRGNLTLAGRATRAEATDLGEAWVVPGYRTASDGRTLVSADGTRTFRPPTSKPNSPFSETGVQVNFETRELIDGRWSVKSNAHLDVYD